MGKIAKRSVEGESELEMNNGGHKEMNTLFRSKESETDEFQIIATTINCLFFSF